MLHQRSWSVTLLNAEIDLSNARNVREARLIHVQGCGALAERNIITAVRTTRSPY